MLPSIHIVLEFPDLIECQTAQITMFYLSIGRINEPNIIRHSSRSCACLWFLIIFPNRPAANWLVGSGWLEQWGGGGICLPPHKGRTFCPSPEYAVFADRAVRRPPRLLRLCWTRSDGFGCRSQWRDYPNPFDHRRTTTLDNMCGTRMSLCVCLHYLHGRRYYNEGLHSAVFLLNVLRSVKNVNKA